jgi:hypothetical protein
MIRITGLSNSSPAGPRIRRTTALLLPFAAATVFAGPKIVFEEKMVDAGKAVEGKNAVVEARFIMKNTGSSDLQLEKVVPACGCTKLTYYDSLVKPGTTGRIDVVMNLKGFRSGPVAKKITVVSNAENEPIARLIIRAIVQEIITVSEPYISLNANHPSPVSIYLSSKKGNLEITDVFFLVEQDPRETSPHWQSGVPVIIPYTWSPIDSTGSDGYRFYKLDLVMPAIERSMLGMFTLKTNHPDKPEIFMRGTLLK